MGRDGVGLRLLGVTAVPLVLFGCVGAINVAAARSACADVQQGAEELVSGSRGLDAIFRMNSARDLADRAGDGTLKGAIENLQGDLLRQVTPASEEAVRSDAKQLTNECQNVGHRVNLPSPLRAPG